MIAVAYFGEFYKLGENLSHYVENAIAKLIYSVIKTFFYEALICSHMLEIIDPIYFQENPFA